MRFRAMCVAGCLAVASATLLAGPQAVSVVPVTPVTPGKPTPPPAPAPGPATITPVNTSAPPAPASVAQSPNYTPQARKLTISFSSGLVTLDASNVTLREILAEWTRVGGTTFVDADKVSGGPVSMEFRNRPELEVLESLLRPLAGNMIDPPLATPVPTKSIYPIVTLLPTSHGTTSGFVPPPPSMQPPGMNGMPDDELPPVRPSMPASGPTPVVVAPVTPTGPGRGGGPGGRR